MAEGLEKTMEPNDSFTNMSVWVPNITKKKQLPWTKSGSPVEVGRPDARLEIVYLGLGREFRVKFVLQNDQKHHISRHPDQGFKALEPLLFEITAKNCF